MEDVLETELAKHGCFKTALVAGAVAGLAVDITLFPLDTIKTRLQSLQGFWAAGGFRGIYSGLLSASVGSAPTAAVFFSTYEMTKEGLSRMTNNQFMPVCHMAAASCGEMTGCLLRVPVEVIKQRAQTSSHLSSVTILRRTIATDGFSGLYRGYASTVAREIPFSFIQFPLWEFFKKLWSEESGIPVTAGMASICGALAGGIAAAITTPLDVAKTRIMLAETGTATARGNIFYVVREVYLQKGIAGIFSGIVPRVTWISIGGAVFLGVYEKTRLTVQDTLH